MSKIIRKNPIQIAGIKKSCQLAAQTLLFAGTLVKEGVTTAYIDQQVDIYIRDHGAIAATLGYGGFPKSCCTSVNEVVCHGIPSSYVLQSGDIVNIDITTILDSYYGDTSAMFRVGDISQAAQELLETTWQALYKGIEVCAPQTPFGEIGAAISNFAEPLGYSVVEEYGGHGIGENFHEEPFIVHVESSRPTPLMQPGMIFTVEPMINLGAAAVEVDPQDDWTVRTVDRQLSAQYEHTILVTAQGYEILTKIAGSH